MLLPELKCSSEVTDSQNCIDELKIAPASLQMISNQLFYFDMLGYSEINISIIYPNFVKYSLYSNKPDSFSNKYKTSIPVSVYDPIQKQYSFGVISIETYS